MVDHKRKKIWDQQWKKRKPDEWHGLTHQRHRETLYKLLEPDEDIEYLIGCHFGTHLSHAGIAAATQRRVICVAKGMASKVTDAIFHRDIGSISYRFAPVTGREFMHGLIGANPRILLAGFGGTGRCTIKCVRFKTLELVNIMPEETVKPFVHHIRSRMEEFHPTTMRSSRTVTLLKEEAGPTMRKCSADTGD